MKKCIYSNFTCLIITVLLLCLPLQTLAYAQAFKTVQYEVKQLPSGEVEIIIPGQIKKTEKTDNVPKSEETQAVSDAKRDVASHFNKTLWFTTGCFLPIFGPMMSQRDLKKIPAARTLGKSPQYVAFYIDTYQNSMKKVRYNWALLGCLTGGLIDLSVVTILINYIY